MQLLRVCVRCLFAPTIKLNKQTKHLSNTGNVKCSLIEVERSGQQFLFIAATDINI